MTWITRSKVLKARRKEYEYLKANYKLSLNFASVGNEIGIDVFSARPVRLTYLHFITSSNKGIRYQPLLENPLTVSSKLNADPGE